MGPWVEENRDTACSESPLVSQPVFCASRCRCSQSILGNIRDERERKTTTRRTNMYETNGKLLNYLNFTWIDQWLLIAFVAMRSNVKKFTGTVRLSPQWMVLCALPNNGHPFQRDHAWFNGAHTGDTVQCSGPFPFDSHCKGGGMTPMRRLLSPGGSERCSSAE